MYKVSLFSPVIHIPKKVVLVPEANQQAGENECK